MKTSLLIGLLSLGLSTAVLAADHEATNPEAQAVDSACTTEAATAGCGNEKVGTGLMKCIHAYKQAHKKDFKISDGCKSAMHSEGAHIKEKRAAKAAAPAAGAPAGGTH
jgi:hypothetical protein